MSRTIHSCSYSIAPLPADWKDSEDLGQWLVEQGRRYSLTTLLAHADDGVIWGLLAGQSLALSGDLFRDCSPELRLITLQQFRFWGPQAELFAWRDGKGGWHSRLLYDDQHDARSLDTALQEAGLQPVSQAGWYFDEPQFLWGDHAEDQQDGFTLVAEGQEGLRHAVPLKVADEAFAKDSHHPLRLGVRHYLGPAAEDKTPILVHGRLTGLWVE